jgi:BirA family biotin operon repressor/biotin-[acetyl-CoA-carboxylase] ligase
LYKAATRVLRLESIDSTNEEAQRRIAVGCEVPLWIVAEEQSHGRGRAGRRWLSPKGNVYASLILRLSVKPAIAAQLSFVTALAAYEAIASHISSAQRPGLSLKWPNDVMLSGAKVAGILIESFASPRGDGLTIIAGIGINVSVAPADTGRPVTTLGLGPEACAPVFATLAAAFETGLARWDAGAGFERIRQAWLGRAHSPGEAITVSLNGSAIQGKFRGVDQGGGLLLETRPGVVITVNAGDIYPSAQN